MKKILLLFLLFSNLTFSQSEDIDATIKNITTEKDADKKVELFVSTFTTEFESNPNLIVETGKKLLQQSQGKNDLIAESAAYSFLGHGYRLAGNRVKALQYHHKAIALAEKTENQSLLSFVNNQLGHIYKDAGENDKAISIYRKAEQYSQKARIKRVNLYPVMNAGMVYLNANKLDSALIYLQRSYEFSLKTKNGAKSSIAILRCLGSVHSKMGNEQLAKSYFSMSLKELGKQKSNRYLSDTYTALAEHFQRFNQNDSCLFYAKKAIAVVKNTKFFYLSNKSALLLTNIYEKTNCDSTLKYSKIYKIANDSLFNSKTNQQVQLMTFEEDLRQQEIAQEKLKQVEQNKQNLQYIFIAIGILTLLILFLLLSRSFITNTKLIQFFGIVGLLIVFEFLNLLLHPFLEKITHHNPILMLLGLVAIAALLVPLHHKVEHWATAKLVEKNKAIRLANAKKTIEELDEKK